MNLINWILNLAGIFLWIDWLSARGGRPQSALSLASTVRPASGSSGRSYGSLIALGAILLIRPLFYYSVGPAVNWTPALNYVATAIPLRSDLLGRMFIFSTVSFVGALGVYYSWLLLLAAVNGAGRLAPEAEPMHRFVRSQLGWLDKIPWWLKVFVPSIAAGVAWMLMSLLFVDLELVPEAQTGSALRGQGAAFAVAAVLTWKWLLIAVFLLHMLNIYVYLGTHPIWPYLSGTARKLLYPLSFLRVGKVDLAPVIGAITVYAFAELFLRPLVVDVFQRHIV
ncbi:MAG TPA: hypothetical protein VF773_04690 [Verrucomicrobiae bacterium]